MNADFKYNEQGYRDQVQKSIGFIPQDLDFYTQVKARWILDVASRRLRNIDSLDVLDVGCGTGMTDTFLVDHFRSLSGIDIDAAAIDTAAHTNPSADYHIYDGSTFPFTEGTFDVVFAINVLHHVPPDKWNEVVAEMHRVLRVGGVALVFEHNPFNPLTRMVVSRCSFDKGVKLLTNRMTRKFLQNASLHPVEHRYILFIPICSNAVAAFERRIGWLPLGAQHYAAAVRLR